MLDLDPIRARAEYTTSNLWTEDTFALLAEVERLRASLDSMDHFAEVAERVERRNNVLRAERDAARAALAQVVLMWDEQISQGLPFLANSDLVPALREILAGYDYDHGV